MSLFLIDEPVEGTASVLDGTSIPGEAPYISGEGRLDLVCGRCERVLVKGIGSVREIQGVVFKCRCGCFNETRM